MRLRHIGWHSITAWRVIIFIILLAVPTYVISDSFLDAAGLDDEPGFDVADGDMIIDPQPIESHGQVLLRSDLPQAAEFRLPALTGALFAWSQPVPAIPGRFHRPARNSGTLPRGMLAASGPTPPVDPAS